MDEMKSDICNDCPRNCNTERSFYADAKSLKTGYCGKAFQPIVARAALRTGGRNPASAAQGDRERSFSAAVICAVYFARMTSSVSMNAGLP